MNEPPHTHEIASLNRLQHWQDSAYLLPTDLLGHLFNQLFSANMPVCTLQNWPACCMLLKFQLSMDAAGLRACCLQRLHEHYLFIAEQYKPGLEAELLWRFAYYIFTLVVGVSSEWWRQKTPSCTGRAKNREQASANFLAKNS